MNSQNSKPSQSRFTRFFKYIFGSSNTNHTSRTNSIKRTTTVCDIKYMNNQLSPTLTEKKVKFDTKVVIVEK